MIPSPRVDYQGRDGRGIDNERALGAALEKQVAHQIGCAEPYPNIVWTSRHADLSSPELYYLLPRCAGNEGGFKRP
jgi:hypothetical protein